MPANLAAADGFQFGSFDALANGVHLHDSRGCGKPPNFSFTCTISNWRPAASCSKVVDGRDNLKFDPDPSRRWILHKLLDDDYLNSKMTDNK